MYKQKELDRINRQKLHDLNHHIEQKTISEWKQDIVDKIFTFNIDYNNKRNVYGDLEGYSGGGVKVVNSGLQGEIKKQVYTYKEVLEEEEIRNICNEIIYKAITKFRIHKDCKKGQEENMLFAYIISCLKTEIQNYIDSYINTIRIRTDKKERVYSADLCLSLEDGSGIMDEEGNELKIKDIASNQDSITAQHDNYKQTDTLKLILSVIADDLSEEQKLLLHLLSIANNNNAQAGLLLKKYDILQGNELRKSNEAYRVFVSREKSKIVNIIENKINIANVSKINKYKDELKEIQNFIDQDDLSIKDVINFAVDNINKKYIEHIVYKLDSKLRQHLIHNFINRDREIENDYKTNEKICTYILKEIYIHIEELKYYIEQLQIKKVDKWGTGLADVSEQVKKYKDCINKNKYKYKYYIIKDKFDKSQRDIKGERVLNVEITRIDMPYSKYKLDTYYLGMREYNRVADRKTVYGKMNLQGVRYVQ